MLTPPSMPPEAYKTYSITQPADLFVKTACENAGCDAFAYGWVTTVDEATPIGETQARYIRYGAKRTFREQRDGALTVFTFDPGQRCFAEHRTRPEHYRVSGGHWQMPFRQPLRDHVNAADWVEDFAEHQQGLADRLAKG